MGFLKNLFGKGPTPGPASAPSEDSTAAEQAAERHWQEVHDARVAIYERAVGPLPQDIQKLGNLLGIWPGGGLYVIPAPKLVPGAAIYTSFGLTNPDMPSTCTIRDLETESDGGRIVRTSGTIVKKENPPVGGAWPGYGYEIIVAAPDNEEWPLWLLQWAVQAEILNDAGMLERVEKYNGLTVEKVQISEHAAVDLLISKARAPLPAELVLPNGRADIIVITVITEAEMRWSHVHGRDALLDALISSGVGQFSELDRESVVSLPNIGAHQVLALSDAATRDFSDVTSIELARTDARLEKILSFPAEFGGDDVALNHLYVPLGVAALKDLVTNDLVEAVEMGLINNLAVEPQYKGDSSVPAALLIEGTHSDTDGRFERTIEIW